MDSDQDLIVALFDRMDAWRHLPSYQLERRADLFFALYLPDVLESKLGYAVAPEVIPEFPVRIGTIRPQSQSNQSFKIDYLALSADGTQAVFVELKTDMGSRRGKQDQYLLAAQEVGLSALLQGVVDLFSVRGLKSKHRRKYYCLLRRLAALGLLDIPPSVHGVMTRHMLQGVTKAAREIKVASRAKGCAVVYVQPSGDGPDVISFGAFRSVVLQHDDPVSQRFAQSLEE